jgi:hypothetical protein
MGIQEEQKSTALGQIEQVQLTSYLKATGMEVGLLLNFGGVSLDFKRMINSKENQRNQRNQRLDEKEAEWIKKQY